MMRSTSLIALALFLPFTLSFLAQTAEAEPPLYRAAEVYAQAADSADLSLAEPLVTGQSPDPDAPWACSSCHGDHAEGAESVPKLAGLPAGYIVKQLHDFRAGRRKNANMEYVANLLSDAEMAALGGWYGRQTAEDTAEPSLGGDIELGRELALRGAASIGLPACFACHGPMGWGAGSAFPPIAGQHAAYLAGQLNAWKSGRRQNSPMGLMQEVVREMSAEDIAAVSDYLASLPPPQPLSDVPIQATEKRGDDG